ERFSDEDKKRIQRLPITDVHVHPDVFQPRHDTDTSAKHAAHVAELIRALHATKALDPITVIRVGGEWILIDGHSRLAAYQEAGGRRTHIPVTVFSGTLDEALQYSIAANTPDKANMTREEKREAMFLLVKRGACTAAEIARLGSASESSVDRMRRDLKTVQRDHPQVDWLTRSYTNVRWTVKNNQGETNPMWKDEKVKRVARVLTKHLGGTALESPAVFAAGMAMHLDDPGLLKAIGEHLLRLAERTDGVKLDF
ncbi:MAG: ParB/RepB/Spo0J family partition protein, partial [Nitrospirae bacterium]|nr:ParB/RepB/Spo0J family partition protein [Nitrospirota bacterium]